MKIRMLAVRLPALLAVALSLAVGFGGSRAMAQSSFTARPQGGIQGALLPGERKLWTYDAASGKYVAVPGDASGEYMPNLRKPAKHLTFAFAEGWAAIPFSVSINKGIYRIAKNLGIDIIYCDQEFKPEKAVTCAEQLSQQKPDFAVVSNWQSGAAEAIMKIYDKAKISVVTIEV
jgi:ribose transport system substrate-binding protein